MTTKLAFVFKIMKLFALTPNSKYGIVAAVTDNSDSVQYHSYRITRTIFNYNALLNTGISQ